MINTQPLQRTKGWTSLPVFLSGDYVALIEHLTGTSPLSGRRYAARSPAMPYFGGMKVRDIIKLLRQDGWYLARTRGSHRQFKHDSKPGTVTVAGKPSLEMPPGTLNSILKQAGLKD